MKAFHGYEWSVQVYMAMILIPMILLNWVRNLKYLAPFSMVANACMAVGLGIIFYYVFQGLPPINREGMVLGFTSIKQLPLFFGTAIYAFEGIGMVRFLTLLHYEAIVHIGADVNSICSKVLPLENNMKTPQDFVGWNGVLNTSMVTVGCLYTAVGFFGYLKYGNDVMGSITLNLPEGDK